MLSDLLQFLMNCSNSDHMSRGVIFVMRVNFCVLHWIDDVAFIKFLLFIFRYYDMHTFPVENVLLYQYIYLYITDCTNISRSFDALKAIERQLYHGRKWQ